MGTSLLVFACVVGAALAGPFQRQAASRCSTHCPSVSDPKFHYKIGNKYVYSYRGENFLEFAGGRKQQKAEMSGKVEIHVKDRCEMILQLRNFEIHSTFSPDESRMFARKLEESPLPFTFVDGKIEHICPSPSETEETQNLKKSILSTFINTMFSLQSPVQQKENDSLGSCETKYQPSRQSGSTLIISKEKSLKSCDNRHSGVTALITDSYKSPESRINTLPIFSDERLHCRQEIKDGVFTKMICEEMSSVTPLSKHGSIVKFEATVELNLETVEKSSGIRTPPFTQKQSILYSYSQDQSVESKEEEVVQILRELCPKSEGMVDPTVSKLYYNLIMAVRSLPSDSVHKIYDMLKTGKICNSQKTRDIFLDSLPMAGTEGAITLMVQLLKAKEVTGLKAQLWPASLALIPYPNAEAVAAVVPLISGEEQSRPVLLGLSAMIYRICSSVDCDEIPAVREVVGILQKELGPHCSSEDETKVISILKAFGNMGYMGPAQKVISECAKSTDRSVSVKLAAVDAYRRYTKKRPHELLELFANPRENFEVRIAALKSCVKDMDPQIWSTIQQVLEHERHEQVSAYTVSLLHNLNETSSPLKRQIKSLLHGYNIKQKDVSYWGNSKNIEFSAFNVPINLGASMEADIIHAPERKIPRSFSSKLDVDLFGSNINLFEFGVRAEGLEAAVHKLLEMANKKMKQPPSWLNTVSASLDSQEKPEAAFFLRTMGTEFFDASTSDLSSMSSMMQYADIYNKLVQGQSIDFSHSFLFLNTKLIIPSITGRSYIFGMTGSATVGLTANGKFDVLNLMKAPRHCDVSGRFQPSANVEITALTGIHGEKSRPNIKVVSLIHTESDVAASFKVKDGHIIEAKWGMPSEHIQFLKVSTDVYEVDSNNKETPVIKEMRQIVDHCVTSMRKPFGFEVCGKLEVPRPYLSRRFPFVRGFGNLELSIRKTDLSMRGYEAVVEIPRYIKHEVLNYRMTVDTPGSKVNRKISANLAIKKPEREMKLDIISPFKNVSTSGSYIMRPELLQGALHFVFDQRRKYSMKAVMEVVQAGPSKTIKPTLQWISPDSEPAIISGSVAYTRGRKDHIAIDLRSNKPADKPISFSGNFIKEGQFALSRKSVWKISSDVVAKTPILTTKFHGILDKKSGRSDSISSTFSLDYERPEAKTAQKQSVKFLTRIQKTSSRLSTSAQFETTQNPLLNWYLDWDLLKSSDESFKNSLDFKYGRNPEQTYIKIHQSCKLGNENSLSEGKISVEAPQFSINSELSVAANLHLKSNPNIHAEADLRYTQDKHIKVLTQLKHLSKRPLKMAVNAYLEYPGRKIMYKDEIQEKSPRVYEGFSVFQWQEGKRATLQYTYKRLSNNKDFHHEIESTLQAPFIRSPVRSVGSLKLSKEALEMKARVQKSQNSNYYLEANLSKQGTSQVSLKIPYADSKLNIVNEQYKKSGSIDIQLKQSSSRRITAGTVLTLGSKKSLKSELLWDANRDPSRKLAFSTELEISERLRDAHSTDTRIQLMDILKVDVSSSCKNGLKGPHEATLNIQGRKIDPVTLAVHHEMSSRSVYTSLTYKKGHVEKAIAEIKGNLTKSPFGSEINVTATLKSRDHSFEDKELHISHARSRFNMGSLVNTTLRIQPVPGKIYEADVSFSNQPRESMNFNVSLRTPHHKFQQQDLQISSRTFGGNYAVNAQARYSGKQVSVSTVVQRNKSGTSVTCTFDSPFAAAKNAKLYAAYENQRSKKHIESHLELNSERKYDVLFNKVSSPAGQEIRSHLKTYATPFIATEVKSSKKDRSFNYEISVMKDSDRLFFTRVAREVSPQDSTYLLEAQKSQKTIVDVRLSKEAHGSVTKRTLKVKGPFTPFSVLLQTTKNDENSVSASLNSCMETRERQCYNLKGYYKREKDTQRYIRYRKITFDIEKVSGSSSAEHLCNVHYLLSEQRNNIKSKLFIDTLQKKVGYDVSLKKRQREDEPCEVDISLILPMRTVSASLSLLHSRQQGAIQFNLIPDASTPSNRLSIELTRKQIPKTNGLDGHLKVEHPVLETPIVVKYSIQRNSSRWPVGGKLEVEYSRNSGDKLMIEMMLHAERSLPGKKSLEYRMYRQDRDLDLTIKAVKQQNSIQKAYGYEWSWQGKREMKTGGFLVTMSSKIYDRPCSVNITYYSPSAQLSIVGNSTWNGPVLTIASLNISSYDQLLGEVLYHRNESCAEVQLSRSGPITTNRVCYYKQQKNLTVETYFRDSKALDMALQLNPSPSRVAKLRIVWKKEDFKSALKNLRDSLPSIRDNSVRELRDEVVEKSKKIYSSVKSRVLVPVYSHLKTEMRKLVEEQKDEIRYLKSLCRQAIQKLPSSELIQLTYMKPVIRKIRSYENDVQGYLQQRAPEWLRKLFREVKEIIEDIFEKWVRDYCSHGTFCYEVKDTYQRQGMAHVRKLMSEKMQEVRQMSSKKLSSAKKWLSSPIDTLKYWTEELKFKVKTLVPKIRDSATLQKLINRYEKVSEYFWQKWTHYFDMLIDKINEMLDHSGHEDLKVVTSFLKNTQTKAIKAWQQMDLQKLQKALQPVRNFIAETYPRSFIKDKLQIQSFNVSAGDVRLQLSQPFDSPKLQILRNAFTYIKNKYQSRS